MYGIHTRDLYFNSAALIVYAERIWLVRAAALMHAIATRRTSHFQRSSRRRSHLIPLIISRCGQRQRFGRPVMQLKPKTAYAYACASYSYVYLCATGSASILTLNGQYTCGCMLMTDAGELKTRTFRVGCSWCIWCFFPITHER